MAIERYIGGGKIYFAEFNGADYGNFVEIGEVQKANLKITTEEADAFSKDSGLKKNVDKVVTAINSNFSFTTTNVNKENMAKAMFGALETEEFKKDDELPDGSIASEDITLPVIIGGVNPIVQGKLKIVGVNVAGSSSPCLIIHHLFLKPSGDVRDYFTDKHSELSFDGEIVEKDGQYFKEYFIPKS